MMEVYKRDVEYAREFGELEQFRASLRENVACRDAIEKAISDNRESPNVDTNIKAAVKQVTDEYGFARTFHVLANTVRQKDWDRRYSDDNKEWAQTWHKSETRTEYTLQQAHPVLVDAFVTYAREMYRQQEQSVAVGVTMETSGLSVPEHEGTWYAVDQREVDGHSFFLMEPNIHEEVLFNIIVDQSGELIMDEVFNGFDDRVMDMLKLLVAPVQTMPDDSISIEDMKDYGYKWGGMLPLREEAAQKLASTFEIHLLHSDNFESLAASNGMQMYEGIIRDHAAEGGIFGVKKQDWLKYLERPRLFIDMDGTLARFHDEVQYLERMYEPDFFRNLQPFRGAVETIREYVREHPDTEVFILSSAIPGNPPGCVQQKQAWLDKYLPEIDHEHRLFPEIGMDKSIVIPGGIRTTDVLLDDYNKNLEEWRQAGGQSVKFVNNINDKALKGERWNGERMRHDATPGDNAKFLARMTGTEKAPPTQRCGTHL